MVLFYFLPPLFYLHHAVHLCSVAAPVYESLACIYFLLPACVKDPWLDLLQLLFWIRHYANWTLVTLVTLTWGWLLSEWYFFGLSLFPSALRSCSFSLMLQCSFSAMRSCCHLTQNFKRSFETSRPIVLLTWFFFSSIVFSSLVTFLIYGLH